MINQFQYQKAGGNNKAGSLHLAQMQSAFACSPLSLAIMSHGMNHSSLLGIGTLQEYGCLLRLPANTNELRYGRGLEHPALTAG